MKPLKVSNPKLQAKLDAISGWKEVALVVVAIGMTILVIWLAVTEKVL